MFTVDVKQQYNQPIWRDTKSFSKITDFRAHNACSKLNENQYASGYSSELHVSGFNIRRVSLSSCREWSGGAMVLGKLPVPGRPTNLDNSRARAYCACSRCG